MALFSKLNNKINTETVKNTPIRDNSLIESDLIFGNLLEDCAEVLQVKEIAENPEMKMAAGRVVDFTSCPNHTRGHDENDMELKVDNENPVDDADKITNDILVRASAMNPAN